MRKKARLARRSIVAFSFRCRWRRSARTLVARASEGEPCAARTRRADPDFLGLVWIVSTERLLDRLDFRYSLLFGDVWRGSPRLPGPTLPRSASHSCSCRRFWKGFAFAIAGALVAFACDRGPAHARPARRARQRLRRSSGCVRVGPLGLPFGNRCVRVRQDATRSARGVRRFVWLTFVVCAIAAYVAYALRTWRDARAPGPRNRPLLVIVAATAAWAALARAPRSAATVPVAAIQGNIAQSIKWTPGAFEIRERTLPGADAPGRTRRPCLHSVARNRRN